MARAFKSDLPPPLEARVWLDADWRQPQFEPSLGDICYSCNHGIVGVIVRKKDSLVQLQVDCDPGDYWKRAIIPIEVTLDIDNPPEFYKRVPGLRLHLDLEGHKSILQRPEGIEAKFGLVTYDTTTQTYCYKNADTTFEWE